MRIVIWGFGSILVLVVVAGIWAALLPAEVSATRTAQIDAPIDRVFGLVTSVRDQTSWRSDVEAVEVAGDAKTWTEFTDLGLVIHFQEIRKGEGVYEIAFSSEQGFSGNWIGRFQTAGDGTTVEIVETVHTESILARAMGRIFAPAGAHIDLYLKDLKLASER